VRAETAVESPSAFRFRVVWVAEGASSSEQEVLLEAGRFGTQR